MFSPSLIAWRTCMMPDSRITLPDGLRADLERVEDGDAGLEQRAERAREAGHGDLAQHRAHDGQVQHQAVKEPLTARLAVEVRDAEREGDERRSVIGKNEMNAFDTSTTARVMKGSSRVRRRSP